MGRRLARLLGLGWGDRLRLVGCVIGLPLVDASLSLFGYARTRRLVERVSQHPRPRAAGPDDFAAAIALAELAGIAGRHGVVRATCLRQSLLLHGWLRRRGLQPALQIGVIGRDGPFEAHAWIELEGRPLLPRDAGHRTFVSPSEFTQR